MPGHRPSLTTSHNAAFVNPPTTTEQLICIGKKDHKAPPDKMPPAVEEPAANKNGKAEQLQVVPADVLLAPGESTEFYDLR